MTQCIFSQSTPEDDGNASIADPLADMTCLTINQTDDVYYLTSYVKLKYGDHMKSWNALAAAVLLVQVSLMVFTTQSALAKEEFLGTANTSLISPFNKTELVSFVESAAAYVQKNGKDNALVEFSNKTGSFVKGDLYIYAYDFNGTNIAHPFNPDWIGQNKLDTTDSYGVPLGKILADVARGGEGFAYFIFPNPAHGNRDELKIGYVMKVDDSWWLGSGLYLSNISTSFGGAKRDELVAFVDEAVRFAKENGKQKSLAVFNDPKGNFTRDELYIFAYDYEGRTLALPYQPDLIGTSRIDAQDPNGVKFIQQAIDTARMQRVFLYYIYPDSSRNMTQSLKLSYVAKIDDTWFLGSGIYANGDEETE